MGSSSPGPSIHELSFSFLRDLGAKTPGERAVTGSQCSGHRTAREQNRGSIFPFQKEVQLIPQ